MNWNAFFTLHKDLEREGPGAPEDVDWVVARTGLDGAVSVLDAGCGPGADLLRFAQVLPEAQLTGLEAQASFVAEAQARLQGFGDRVQVSVGDMSSPGGTFDLIWCAGALYFLGVEQGLTAWLKHLAPGGWVAFSEPVLLDGHQPDAVTEFWAEYPAITDLAGIAARVDAAQYEIVDHRLIVGAPWALYYASMRDRIAELRATNPSPELVEVLDENAREIALWDAAPNHIAYAMMLVRPK